MAHLISTDGYTSVVKIEPTTMMPHPPTLEPPVENPTYHWLTTPQMSATQNEYPLVPNVPQQTRPLSTPQIKTEPVDFSVQLQGATYPDTLTPSQLPTHTPPTTSFSTPTMNSEPLLPTPLLDIRFPPAPSLEEQKMRKSAQKAKRRFENAAKMREKKARRELKKQEARNKTLNSKKKKSRGNKTDDLRKKVKYLCAYNKANPRKILQILLEHYTHEKILQHYYSNTALKKYIRTVIDNGLLEFNMTIPSGMDTNQPGPSGTSGPVNPSHGSSASVAQESSFNVVTMESPLAGDFVNMRKNQQSLVSVIKLTSIQPLVQQRNDRMSIVGLATRSVTVGTQTPTDHFRSLTTEVTDASNNEQMESSSVTMEDSNPEQMTSRKVQETNSSSVTSDVSLSNATSNIGTAEDTSESNVTSNIGTPVTAEDTSESNVTSNIGIAVTVEDTSDTNVTSNIATSNIGTPVTVEDTSESNVTSNIGTPVTVEDTSESNATSNIGTAVTVEDTSESNATSNIGTAVTVEDTSESNATSNIGTAVTVEDTSESNATSNIGTAVTVEDTSESNATSNIGTAVTVEDTSESNATSNIGTAVTVEDTSESNATSNIGTAVTVEDTSESNATSNIGTAVTVEDTSESNATSNIGTAVTVEDTSESNATSNIGTAVTVEDTSESNATSNIGTAVTVEDTSDSNATSNIGTAVTVEDTSESNATSNIGTAVTVEDTSDSNATSNIGTAVTVEDTSDSNATSNIGTAVEDASESNATSNIETAVTVEDTSDSNATSNIGTVEDTSDSNATSNIGTAVEDASESPEKAEPMITVAYLDDRCANELGQSLKESVSTSRFKSESSDFSNESHPSPGVVTEPIGSARPVAVPPGYPLVIPRGSDEGLLLFENVDMTKYKPSRAAFVTFINVTSTSTLPPPHTSPVAMETETSLTRLNPPTPPSLPHTPQPPVNTESDEEFLYGDNDCDQTPPPDIQLDSPATQLPRDSQPLLDSPPSDQQPAKPPPSDSDPSIDRLLDLIGQSSNPDPPEEPPLMDPPEESPLMDPPDELPLMDPPNEPPLLNPPEEPPLLNPPEEPPLMDPPEEPPLMDPPEEPPLMDPPNEPPLLNPPEEPPLLNPPDGLPLMDPPEEPPLLNAPEEPPLLNPPDGLPLMDPPEEPPLLNPPDELPLMDPTSQPSEQRSDLERDGHQSRDTPPSPGRPAHSMLLLEPELQDTTAMLKQAFSILPTLTEWPREKCSKKKKQNQSSMKSKVHCIRDTNLNQDSSNWSDEGGKTAVDITKRNKHSTKRSARIPFTSSAASDNSDHSWNEDTSSYTTSPTPAKKQKQQLRRISPQPDPPSRTQSPREQAPSNQTSGRHSPSTEQDKDMSSDTDMERGSDTGMERGSIKQAGTKHTRDSSLDTTPPSKKRRVSSTGDATPSPAHAVSDVINNAIGAEDVIIDVDALPDIIVMEQVSPSSDTDVDVGGDSQYPSLFSPAKIEWSPKRIDKDGVLETDKEPATRRQIVFPLSTAVDIADSQDLLVDRTKRAPPHIDLLRETSHGDLLRRTYHGDLLKGTSHGDLLRRTSPGEDEIVQVDSPESVAESAVSAKGSPTHEITRKDHQQFSIKLEQTSVDCQLDGAQSISTDKPHSTTPSKYNIESPPSRSSSRASTPRRLPQRLPLKFSTRPHIKLSIDKSNTGDKSVCNRTGELTFGSTPFSQPAYQKLSASNQNETKQTLLQLREAGIELTRDFCDRSDKAEALIYRIAHAFFTEEHKLQ